VGDVVGLVVDPEDPEVEEAPAGVVAVLVVGGAEASAPTPPVATPVKLTAGSFIPMAPAADCKSLKLPVPLAGAFIAATICWPQ